MSDEDGAGPDLAQDVLAIRVIDLEWLRLERDAAYKMYQDEPLTGFRRAMVALRPVLEVTDPDRRRGHRHMFNQLVETLIDLDLGHEPILLRKRKSMHRSQLPSGVWYRRGIAAHLADLLERTGMTSDDANRDVAKLLLNCRVEVGRRSSPKPSHTVVERWRRDLKGGRADVVGNRAYEEMRTRIPDIPSSLRPAEARRILLDFFRTLLTAEQSGDRRAVHERFE